MTKRRSGRRRSSRGRGNFGKMPTIPVESILVFILLGGLVFGVGVTALRNRGVEFPSFQIPAIETGNIHLPNLGSLFSAPTDSPPIEIPVITDLFTPTGGGGSGGSSNPVDSATEVSIPLNLSYEYGESGVSVDNSLSLLSVFDGGGNTISSINCVATLSYTSTGEVKDIEFLDEVEVHFDGVVKKSIPFAIPADVSSPMTIASISVTASEIEAWSTSDGEHTLTFIVPEGGEITFDFGYMTKAYTVTSSVKSIVVSTNSASNIHEVYVSGSTYYWEKPSGVTESYSSFTTLFNKVLNAYKVGEEIHIKAGTYTKTGWITGGSSAATTGSYIIYGDGYDSTIIQSGDGDNVPVMEFYARTSSDIVSVKNLQVNGRRGTGQVQAGDGLRFIDVSCSLYRVKAVNTWGTGLLALANNAYPAKAEFIECIGVSNGNPSTYMGCAIRVDRSATGTPGKFGQVTIRGCTGRDGYEHGFKVYPNIASGVIIEGNTVENSLGTGIWSESAGSITSNTIKNTGKYGVVIDRFPIVVQDNVLVDCGKTYQYGVGIAVNSLCNGAKLIQNTVTGSPTMIQDLGTGTIYINQPTDDTPTDPTLYEISRVGNTYYATGGLSSTSFLTLWNSVTSKVTSGDTIHLAGNTDYVTTSTIVQPKDDITLKGSPGARIRPVDSTLLVYIFQNKGQNFVMDGVTISGLGANDNRDTFGWNGIINAYQLAVMSGTDNVVIQNCVFEHHHQYLLQLSNCKNYLIKNNVFRYGQNGFATYGSGNVGVIEYNLIHDCSQSAIKLRGDTGTIVRHNTIREEYTYWRSFDHLRYPGVDGRGIEGHNTQGCQGIYFGVTDPQPCFNCDVYENTITDASKHGTVNIIDVVDGQSRASPPYSDGCWFPLDAGTTKSSGNKFHDNSISGAYTGVNVEGYTTRSPQPLEVYSNSFTDIVQNKYPNAQSSTISIGGVAYPYTVEGGKKVVLVSSTITLSQSYDGKNELILRRTDSLGDVPIMKVTGTGVTVKNIFFDDINLGYSNGAVALSGTDNVMESCTLDNCQRYGFIFQTATRCTFRGLIVNKGQHCISGSSGFDGQWNPSVDCVIEDCTIKGMIIDGIKLKNMLRPIVRRNTIDVYPLYPTYLGQTTKYSKSGIYFAGGDSAIKFGVVEDNYIFQSAPNPIGLSSNRAVCVFPDQTTHPEVYSEGNKIINNRFSNVYTGVWFKSGTHGYYAADNEMTGVSVPYDDDGDNTVVP